MFQQKNVLNTTLKFHPQCSNILILFLLSVICISGKKLPSVSRSSVDGFLQVKDCQVFQSLKF